MSKKLRRVTVFERVFKDEDGELIRQPRKKELCSGLFHCFGCDFEEFETGPGNYSTAIVELPNGNVINVDVELIRFDDRYEAS